MAGERARIGVKAVESLPPKTTIWDATVTGFGARRQTGPGVAYVVSYRTAEGRPRMQTIGRHGAPWTPETARAEARRILGEVATGRDPAAAKRERRAAPTVAELCDDYLREAEAGRLLTRRGAAKKPSTIETDRSRIDCHIRPLLGAAKVAAVTPRDIERVMHGIAEGKTHRRVKLGRPRAVSNVRAGKGGAARVIGLLGAIFAFAVKRGLREDNPVRGVVRYANGRRERRLSVEDYRALGDALRRLATIHTDAKGRSHGAVWPPALACIRFLALTGWRRSEAWALRWRDVDLATRTARLPDTKTGASVRALSRRACDVLQAQTRGDGAALVFPPSRGAGVMTGLPRFLARVVKAAELPADVTAHTLRHSFASMAADGGASEFTVAALLGHRAGSVTGRYVHSADAVLLAAADRVAESIAEAMGDARAGAAVVALAERRA